MLSKNTRSSLYQSVVHPISLRALPLIVLSLSLTQPCAADLDDFRALSNVTLCEIVVGGITRRISHSMGNYVDMPWRPLKYFISRTPAPLLKLKIPLRNVNVHHDLPFSREDLEQVDRVAQSLTIEDVIKLKEYISKTFWINSFHVRELERFLERRFGPHRAIRFLENAYLVMLLLKKKDLEAALDVANLLLQVKDIAEVDLTVSGFHSFNGEIAAIFLEAMSRDPKVFLKLLDTLTRMHLPEVRRAFLSVRAESGEGIIIALLKRYSELSESNGEEPNLDEKKLKAVMDFLTLEIQLLHERGMTRQALSAASFALEFLKDQDPTRRELDLVWASFTGFLGGIGFVLQNHPGEGIVLRLKTGVGVAEGRPSRSGPAFAQ